MAKKQKVSLRKRSTQNVLVQQKANREYQDIDVSGGDLNKALLLSAKAEDTYLAAQKKSIVADGVAALAQRIHYEQMTKLALEDAKESMDSAAQTKVDYQKLKAERAKAKKAAMAKLAAAEGSNEALFAAQEAVRLFGVVLRVQEEAPKARLTEASIRFVEGYQAKAKQAIYALQVGTQVRLTLFAEYLAYSRRLRELRPYEEYVPSLSDIPKKEAPSDAPPPDDGGGPKDKRKSFKDRVLGLGSKLSDKLTSIQRAMMLAGRVTHDEDESGDTAPDRSTFVSPKSVGKYAVQAINRVGSGLREVGKAIKENGTDTMKWVGGLLSSMNRRFLGSLRSIRDRLGFGGPSDWLAMGAIATGILPSLIDGFTSYMKEQYGDRWLTSFISEKWSETKKTVLEWLDRFIAKAVDSISNLPEKLKELGEAAKNVPHVVSEILDPSNKTAKYNDTVKAVEQSKATGTKVLAPIQRIAKYLGDYEAAKTPEEKADIESNIIAMMRSYPYLRDEPSILNKMTKLGIKFSFKNRFGKTVSTVQEGATTAPVSIKNSSAANVSVSRGSGAPTGSITAEPPSPPSGGSDGPVTATKPEGGGGSLGAVEGGNDSRNVPSLASPGLSNMVIPNQGTSDTLTLINFQGLSLA